MLQKQRGAAGVVILILIILGLAISYTYVFYIKPLSHVGKPPSENTDFSTVINLPNKLLGSGLNSRMVVKPTKGKVVTGNINVSMTKVPEDTAHVGYAIMESLDFEGPEGLKLTYTSESEDNWLKVLDTTEYPNGVYQIVGLALKDTESPPLGIVNIKVEIQN